MYYVLYKTYNNRMLIMQYNYFLINYLGYVIEVPNTILNLHMEIIAYNAEIYMLLL